MWTSKGEILGEDCHKNDIQLPQMNLIINSFSILRTLPPLFHQLITKDVKQQCIGVKIFKDHPIHYLQET
jgi:hypothetical protein